MSAVEYLKSARDIVAKGWCKGALKAGRGGYCIRGALSMAMDGRPHMAPTEWWRRDEVEDVLVAHMPYPTTIPHFNDAESTTHRDVLNLFDKALADLGGLA